MDDDGGGNYNWIGREEEGEDVKYEWTPDKKHENK